MSLRTTKNSAVENPPSEFANNETPANSTSKKLPSGLFAKYGIVLAWIFEIVVFALIEHASFFTANNFKEIASSQADLVILAISAVPTMATGEVDLSIASVMGLSAILFGQLNGVDHWSVALSIAISLGASLIVGAINGIITVFLRVRGMIVTLGMGTFVLGLTIEISNSLTVSGISLAVQKAMNAELFGISLAFYYALLAVILLWYLFRHTASGRSMLFLGFNREVARLSGINVSKLRLFGFILGSFLAGLAGIVAIGVSGGAEPSSFQPLLLPALAATFLGSLIFTPGRINAAGSMVALYFLATGIVGIQLLGVGSWIDDAFYGGALVVAVALSGLSEILGLRVRKVNN